MLELTASYMILEIYLVQLLLTYCLDLYGSQLWNFSSIDVQSFFVVWRKSMRRLWKLPNTG